MGNFQSLYDFIDRAIKSRKYPENTGMSLKSALKLFEAELNEEENNSVDEFSKHLEQIYQSVFSKNKNFSAASLATYKSRVGKVLADYKKYGMDPIKMVSWLPKIIKRSKKQSMSENKNSLAGISIFHTFDFTGGVKLLIPKTVKATEAIMDGALKQIKIELKKFSDEYCEEEEMQEADLKQ